MKKETLGGVLLIVTVGIAAFWLNLESTGANNLGQSAPVQPSRFILAFSWQSAFCESRPYRAECRSQHKGRFDTTHFSLHGLWPQTNGRTHCDIDQSLIALDKQGKWNQLPRLDLSRELRGELSIKMPGYRSYLHRHEWYKHGSCIKAWSSEAYFRISLALLDQLNESPLRSLMVNNLGKELHYGDLAEALSAGLGGNLENRLILDCYHDKGRRIIQEIRLSIGGPLNTKTSLGKALSRGDPVGRSCPQGEVDRTGLQ